MLALLSNYKINRSFLLGLRAHVTYYVFRNPWTFMIAHGKQKYCLFSVNGLEYLIQHLNFHHILVQLIKLPYKNQSFLKQMFIQCCDFDVFKWQTYLSKIITKTNIIGEQRVALYQTSQSITVQFNSETL